MRVWRSIQFNAGRPISVDLPPTVDLKVIETEPGLRTGSVSNGGKPAKLESGLIVSVPQFVNEGKYQERVATA
jgi:elongation factor P